MKKFIKALLWILLAAILAGFLYWQINKKRIIKSAVENTIEKKSGRLYDIHYDSSSINELTGSAAFYNIVLQPDSAQKKLLEKTGSLPNMLYRIAVAEVSAAGVNIPGLLQKHTLSAASLKLIRPVINITSTGADQPKPFTDKDTLELYKKIIGNFTSIRAASIEVINGTFMITDKKNKILTKAENINISLHDFLIDSTRNYQNIISYFIKDVNVSAANVQLPETNDHKVMLIGNIVYDAPGKKLQIGKLQQSKIGDALPDVDIKNIVISQLSTDAFIMAHQLKAGLLTTDGGLLTIYKKKKKSGHNAEKVLEFSSDVIESIQVSAIQTGSITVAVKDADDLSAPPFIINKVKCSASNIAPAVEGSTLSSLFNNAEWTINAGGFSFSSSNKIYILSAEDLELDSRGAMNIKKLVLKPTLSEAAFSRISPFQDDLYNLSFTNIRATGTAFKKLISSNILEIDALTFQPLIKVYDDRTLPFDERITFKKYPYQFLQDLAFHFGIKKLSVNNGAVYYREKGKLTGKPGTVYFTGINGTLENITNIPEWLQADNKLRLQATAYLLGKAQAKTEWILPLQNTDTVFTVTGKIGRFNGIILNPLIEPLGKVSIQKGIINSLAFDIRGTNYKGMGNSTFLYNDLKIEALKMDEKNFKKKRIVTFLANTLIKNDNPKNGTTRPGRIDFDRDVLKSFFNLLWKSILSGVKHTAI